MKLLLFNIVGTELLFLIVVYGVFIDFDLFLFIIGAIIISVFFIFPIIFYTIEKRKYNNGVCPFCGGKLSYIEDDASGKRRYRCSKNKDYDIWIDWFYPNN